MERPVGGISHMGQTYIKVKGVCKYRYRAVGKQCKIVDLLLKATRDIAAAKRVVRKAMELTAILTRSRWTRTAPTMQQSMQSTPGARYRPWCATHIPQ
jgi:transposase-like protein